MDAEHDEFMAASGDYLRQDLARWHNAPSQVKRSLALLGLELAEIGAKLIVLTDPLTPREEVS